MSVSSLGSRGQHTWQAACNRLGFVVHTAVSHWCKGLIFDLVGGGGGKYCIGRTLLLLLHSSLGVTGTKWQDEWGRVGASDEDRMEGGGGGGGRGVPR